MCICVCKYMLSIPDQFVTKIENVLTPHSLG